MTKLIAISSVRLEPETVIELKSIIDRLQEKNPEGKFSMSSAIRYAVHSLIIADGKRQEKQSLRSRTA